MASVWTPERTALLRELWEDGEGAGDIARRLGVTRGMVAGKRHSLGLEPRSLAQVKAAQAANARRTAALCGHVGRREVSPMRTALAERAAADLERISRPIAGSNPRPWELRAWGECAFPVAGMGGATWSCCGPVEPGFGYCHGHREILAGRPWPPEDPPADLAATQWAPVDAGHDRSDLTVRMLHPKGRPHVRHATAS